MVTLNKHAKVSMVTFLPPESALGRLVCHVCMTSYKTADMPSCSVFVKFFLSFCQSRYNSVMTWPILTKPGGKDHWPCPNMSYDFDLRMTFDLDIGVKNVIFYKSLLLRQITCDDNMSWSCYLTLVSASGVCSVKGSKVIKGSFPVKSPKILRKS